MPPSTYESDQKPQSKGFFSSLLAQYQVGWRFLIRVTDKNALGVEAQ